MRLDHLLSKEHWPVILLGDMSRSRATLETFALEVELKGGTLTSRPSRSRRTPSTAGLPVGTEGASGGGGPGALLGPEGAGRTHRVRHDLGDTEPPYEQPTRLSGRGLRHGRTGPRRTALVREQATGGDRDRPYFENCTVDASIFVAKLVRAHGGCLGTRSR